jgi:thiol-disulfide isomerase/thioredoxin
MNRRVLGIISVVAIALLVVVGVIYVKLHPSAQLQNASVAPADGSIEIGSRAPQFTIPTTQGPFDLNAETKPVFLEIFATWCPHCQRETVILNALYATYGTRVAFIAIPGSETGMDGTSAESPFDVLNFVMAFKVKYPIGEYDPNLTIAKLWLKGGYPTIAVIGENKIVSYINSGEIPQKELAAQLDRALK